MAKEAERLQAIEAKTAAREAEKRDKEAKKEEERKAKAEKKKEREDKKLKKPESVEKEAKIATKPESVKKSLALTPLPPVKRQKLDNKDEQKSKLTSYFNTAAPNVPEAAGTANLRQMNLLDAFKRCSGPTEDIAAIQAALEAVSKPEAKKSRGRPRGSTKSRSSADASTKKIESQDKH